MAELGQSRRNFLGTLIALAAGGWFLGKFLAPQQRRKKTLLTVAKRDLPHDGALVYREARIALLNRGGRVYALNLVCTHLGCTVNVTPAGLVCPCHGSEFDREGRVVKGPADRALERYQVNAVGDTYQVTA
ncbi:Rieske (2Fe-2S) protein [Geomonas sp. Red69]|uniref:Rieske (2Fe-2S) protein n=1 Tax=Geomonas diazotrophica TaxID=2843197 RepID=A0ABX8JI84_9BACT|nr:MULTISPECIES: Rieske (2Fe-2S) protein [Geomonas]MBU5638425.1 Rieske (2Fe-2S) protein [Geomonas diazotrophica]QWV97334.1 Rieske (2Fe-2S) protein [Geomonas nitrogeniifigens]QXE86491.1 Rieske (2Fe-2S) protein [Geomonas nitrogeniifigens]